MTTATPANIQALGNQAIAFHQQGNLAEAERVCLQILRMVAANPLARNILGLIRSGQGRHREALDLIGGVLKEHPNSTAALANYGLVLHAAQRFDEALAAFDMFLEIAPDQPVVLVNRANTLRSLERYEDALAAYDRALTLQPNYAEGYYNRAVTLNGMSRLEGALADYDNALALQPNLFPALCNRASLLLALKRHHDALAAYDKVLTLDSRHAATLYNRGIVLSEIGRNADALASYDKAIAAQPSFAAALANRGNVLRVMQRWDDALASYDKALAIDPEDAATIYNRGVTLADLGRYEAALREYDRALKIRPNHADTLYNRGIALTELRRLDAALDSYDKALAADPNYAEAWNNRGIVLKETRKLKEAVASFDRAIAVRSAYTDALVNRSYVRWNLDRELPPAIADLERALAIDPNYTYARGDLLHLRMHAGDWKDYAQEVASLEADMPTGKSVVRPFVYQAISASPADLQACSTAFAKRFPALQPEAWKQGVRNHSKIRIGYVSADFREQATAYLMAGLFEEHDKSRFKIIAFDNGWDDGSAMRKRLESAFDKIIDISTLSDEAAAHRIRAEEIDILISLNGYFGEARAGIFARKPAPIQVNYLGFPATLGASYMDYIIADRVVIPEDERRFYTEHVVYLPDSYQANDSKRLIDNEAPSRAACGLPENAFVFCNFNQSYKLVPDTFAGWMRILKQVPGSVLWLLENNPQFRENMQREAAAHGIAPERIVFAPHLPLSKHLARLQRADLFLDSLPYNAHTTASDALWAGVPIVTRRGTAFPGRVAASLLQAAGLTGLITESQDEFEALAVNLATDKTEMRAVQQRLTANRRACPLFDTQLFRRDIELAYTMMFDLHSKGKPPCAFEVKG